MKNKYNLRKLIREALSELKLINETMSLYVKDYVPPARTDSIETLCHHLLQKIISPYLDKLPQDQQDYFKKNGVGFYDTLIPDGSAQYGNSIGIINFYISGFTSKTLRIILLALSEELKRLGIKIGSMKREQSRMYKSQVIRIPIVSNQTKYEGPNGITFANSNAYHIFNNILQYEGIHNFKMNAAELKQRIDMALNDKGWISKHQLPDKIINPQLLPSQGEEWKDSTEDATDDDFENPHNAWLQSLGNQMGTTLHSFGMSEEDIKLRLKEIWKFADWAVKNGFQEIYVT
jgi:hypothetical protein